MATSEALNQVNIDANEIKMGNDTHNEDNDNAQSNSPKDVIVESDRTTEPVLESSPTKSADDQQTEVVIVNHPSIASDSVGIDDNSVSLTAELVKHLASPEREDVIYCNIQNMIMDAQYIYVDGDSLLIDFISSKFVDWSNGGQIISLLYQIELFISILTVHTKSVIRVTFFKCMTAFWLSDPVKLLARHILMSHLQYNCNMTLLTQFDSWLDKDFIHHSDIFYPYFVFMTDKQYNTLKDTPMGEAFILMEYSYLKKHTHSAYISTLLENMARVYCFIGVNLKLPTSLQVPSIIDIREYLIQLIQHSTKHQVFSETESDLISTRTNLINDIKKLLLEKNENIRELISLPVLAQLLDAPHKHNKEFVAIYIRAYIVHLVILNYVDIESRSVFIPQIDNPEMQALVQDIMNVHYTASFYYMLVLQILSYEAHRSGEDKGSSIPLQAAREYLFSISKEERDLLGDLNLHSNLFSNLADLYDGRLLTYVIFYFLNCLSKNGKMSLDVLGFTSEMLEYFNHLWTNFRELTTPSDHLSDPFPVISPPNLNFMVELKPNIQSVEILPVKITSCGFPLIQHLSREIEEAMIKDIEDNKSALVYPLNPEFQTDNTTIILKPLIGNLPERVNEALSKNEDALESKEKKLRKIQKLHAFMQFYSASLSNINSWREPIVVQKVTDRDTAKQKRLEDKQAKADAINSQSKRQPGSSGGKKGAGNKKVQLIESNMERIITQQEAKYSVEWNNLKDKLKSALQSDSHIKELSTFINNCPMKKYKHEAKLLKLQYLIGSYLEDKTNVFYKVAIMELISIIINENTVEKFNPVKKSSKAATAEALYECTLPEKDKKKIIKSILILGFDSFAEMVGEEIGFDTSTIKTMDSQSNENDDNDNDLHSNSDESDSLTAVEFQLKYMGHLLPRTVNKGYDPRITNFIPDPWQVKLLDLVDRNESAVIHAPTSSGKTFISYYAMLKILRANDEDLVVYVSPSKELMNQVSASIYANFGHKTYKTAKYTQSGILSHKYDNNLFNCQILVTLPEPFQYILLSIDPQCRELVKRIKYVIFDEVHCISAEEGSEKWEQLLLLIQSPFLALSATIGNAQEFTDWLISVQRRKFAHYLKENKVLPSAARVRIVEHSQRFSDLAKYRYDAKSENIHHVHPWLSIKYEHFKLSGYPPDLTLMSDECVEAYRLMSKVARESPEMDPALFDELMSNDPNSFFDGKRQIHKADVSIYSGKLSSILMKWVEKDYKAEYSHLMQLLDEQCHSEERVSKKKHPKSVEVKQNKLKLEESEDLKFLRHLNLTGKLPCVIFILDLYEVEKFVNKIITELEQLEEKKWAMEDSDEDSRKEKHLRDINKELEKLNKRLGTKLDEEAREEVEEQILSMTEELSNQNEFQVDPEYTFVQQGIFTKAEKNKSLERIRKKKEAKSPTTKLFERAMERGIICHHEELKAREKEVAEIAFRFGHIQVLVATQTLSLGIHMPCRTVVFYKDSVQLNALQFRQMSGRSGRRGYDLVGYVTFKNIHKEKFDLLNTAPVPRLYGNNIWSSTFLFRLLLLLAEYPSPEHIYMAMTLFSSPFLSHDNKLIQDIVKHEVLFSAHFLILEGYLNQNETVTSIGNILSYVSFVEPSNFVFCYLLRYGVFEQICSNYSQKSTDERKKVREECFLLLCHIFSVQRLPPMKVNESTKLHDLPHNISKMLNNYYARAFKLYSYHIKFMISFLGKKKCLSKTRMLPVSKREFSKNHIETSQNGDTLLEILLNSGQISPVVPPFFSLSGINESDITNLESLNNCMPLEVNLDLMFNPVSILWSADGIGQHKNGYLMHVFKETGVTVPALILKFGITDFELFNYINNFHILLKAIYLAMSVIYKLENNVRVVFDHISDEFKNKMNNLYRGIK